MFLIFKQFKILKIQEFARFFYKSSQQLNPILCKRGSFIVWSSSVVHSAKYSDKKEKYNKYDKYLGWRGVIYVSYRPKSEYDTRSLNKRAKCVENNRVTNHWGTKVFGKIPGGRYASQIKRHPEIIRLSKNPEEVYKKTGIYQNLTEKQEMLAGLRD